MDKRLVLRRHPSPDVEPPQMQRVPEVTPGTPPAECDAVVVGAGIVGLATARELALRHPGIEVAVLERERRIAGHQTGHTSGVVHSGLPYEPGSLRARLCVEGARDLYALCAERGIPARRDGKLVVATRPGDLPRLDELERRGRANGVPGLARLRADEIGEVEPAATGLAALYSPATGVVDFTEVARALADDLRAQGGRVVTGCDVASATSIGDRAVVGHSAGRTHARCVIACAGLWSDRLAEASGAPADPRVVPFRGAYLRLRPERAGLVRASIYPVPDPALPFLGAHLTRTLDGAVLLGPTALMAPARDAYSLVRLRPADLLATLGWPGTWRLATRHRRAALREAAHAVAPALLVGEARRMVPGLRRRDFTRGPAGVRAQALSRDGRLVDDFVVSRDERCVHVRNAPSPAATSALALARLIADEVDSPLRG